MTLEDARVELEKLEEALSAYEHAMSVLYTDGDTAAPRSSYKGRGKTVSYLSGVVYRLMTSENVREALQTILDARSACDEKTVRRAEVLMEQLDELTRIPMDEYVAYQALQSEANAVWHDAKSQSDYALFAPFLEKLIAYERRFAAYKDPARPAYDVLLDKYEKGMTMAALDPFFALLREKLTPVILSVAGKPAPRTDFLHRFYPAEQQRRFSDRLMAMMGIDRDCCSIAETEHPFTNGANKWDVRITTHYYENDVASSMFSVIHEGGHALYEMGVADELQYTCLAGGATMGLHESQSRFYENLIGRSRAFCGALYPVMRELFPDQLRDVTEQELYRAVNMSTPSLIRTEADELTYAMHVMIRYEMEKLMMSGQAKVADLPALWNDMYRRYLGVEVPCDREGILQDSHWSGGSFGYFPSYALGSAYGVQMLDAMKKTVDVDAASAAGDLRPVTAWLCERIHRHGKLLTPAQLLERGMEGPFDPSRFVTYLTEKFTGLYDL